MGVSDDGVTAEPVGVELMYTEGAMDVARSVMATLARLHRDYLGDAAAILLPTATLPGVTKMWGVDVLHVDITAPMIGLPCPPRA